MQKTALDLVQHHQQAEEKVRIKDCYCSETMRVHGKRIDWSVRQ